MANQFNTIPVNATRKLEPFTLQVPQESLSEFRELLKLSKIGPATWWNQYDDHRFGVSREWISNAKETWLTSFDWRKHEEHINSFPNFKVAIEDIDAGQIEIHFAALFSTNKDAIPVMFMHGFPGSFLEFLPMLQLLVDKYTPDSLPYHVIVPSLPGYGLSGSASRNVEMSVALAARIMSQLMVDLGFGGGYIAQGGDLGSMIARVMSVEYKECKAFHVNMLTLNPGETVPPSASPTPEEQEHMERNKAWLQTGLAYALEHGTRPATVGLAISSSPLALLAWIGEKLLEWVDPRDPLPLDTVLAVVSLWWYTDTFPHSLYHAGLVKNHMENNPHPTSKEKPFGYSRFPYDLAILPHAWAKQVFPNLVFFNTHSKGGHFASMEQPKAFLEDIEEFVKKVGGGFRAN